jgi:membrane protease YdiL (CAAX protease family)
MVLLWIYFLLFLLYFVGYETVWGLTGYKKYMAAIETGKLKKVKMYVRLMLGLWIPAGLVLILLSTGRLTLTDLGLGWFKPYGLTWLFYSSVVLAMLYFLYLAYSLVALRINAIKKTSIKQKLPDKVKLLLPITKKEKKVWALTALTAGITEELLFRGFLFFLMTALFPGLNIFIILGISTLIFGIGHLYQGPAEAVKPMILGLLFGLFYISFGTILPCIILHAMQDLCGVDMIND